MNKPRIILAGGSGFTGQALADYFEKRGHEIVVLTRSPKPRAGAIREVAWDGETPGAWAEELEGALAVINLAGRSVDCRYTQRNRRLILDSRVNSTRVLGAALAQCAQPPRVWLNSGTATIYRHSLDKPMDEATGEFDATPAARDVFSVEVARAWERAVNEARTPATRKVVLRTTMVLGQSTNSVFPVLCRLTRRGLGGKMGSGDQYVSWIHEEDFCRAIEWIIGREDLSGPVNLAAPHPLPNREMMGTFRQVCGVPFGLPATEWMLEVGAFFLRTETELILKSRRVVPGKLAASGFQFHFPHFKQALENLLARSTG